MQDFFLLSKKIIQSTSVWEWIAVITALLQVLLAAANKASNFLFGFVSTGIYIGLYLAGKLYADAALNSYYCIVSVVGFFLWRKNSTQVALPIMRINTKQAIQAIAIAVISFLISFFVLTHYTDSTVPLQDSLVAALAWAGTWLLTRRVVENWLVLNASNAIAIPLLYQKQYYLSSLLTIILFLVAMVAWWRWRAIAKKIG